MNFVVFIYKFNRNRFFGFFVLGVILFLLNSTKDVGFILCSVVYSSICESIIIHILHSFRKHNGDNVG